MVQVVDSLSNLTLGRLCGQQTFAVEADGKPIGQQATGRLHQHHFALANSQDADERGQVLRLHRARHASEGTGAATRQAWTARSSSQRCDEPGRPSR